MRYKKSQETKFLAKKLHYHYDLTISRRLQSGNFFHFLIFVRGKGDYKISHRIDFN